MKTTRTLLFLALLPACWLLSVSACLVPGAAMSGNSTPAGQQNRSTIVDENLAYCSSSNDCSSGEFCKNRGDGMKLCMGNGYNGDYCSNGNDCGSGMFCKGRGDGLKVCMGNGGQGAFCSNGNDCDSGMFCKPRGDGYKVCM